MLWTKALGLNLKQNEVDFVIPDLARDLRLYVDPLLFYRSPLTSYQEVHALLHQFFATAIDAVKNGEAYTAERMLDFPEVKEIMFGMSKHSHKGRGMGESKGRVIFDEIVSNADVLDKGITHLAEMQLLIDGVGYDLISDMCTNIAKVFFINYTQHQCNLHGIKLERGICLEHVFNWDELSWDDIHTDLPINPVSEQPILLVPKDVVRRFPIFDYEDFWTSTYRYILRNNVLSTSVTSIGKEPKIYWKDINKKFNFCKRTVVEVLHQHPELRHAYVDKFESRVKKVVIPNDLFKIQGAENFQAPVDDLINELQQTPSGNAHAKAYERLILRILTRLFTPPLSSPSSQVTSHDNREIIDITFYNSAEKGFWFDVKNMWRGQIVVFELKNMTDLNNEEFFQLSARLDDIRGTFGVLVSRAKDNLDIQRAYRRLSNERKVLLVLTDEDLIRMLKIGANGEDPINEMQQIYRTFIDEH